MDVSIEMSLTGLLTDVSIDHHLGIILTSKREGEPLEISPTGLLTDVSTDRPLGIVLTSSRVG